MRIASIPAPGLKSKDFLSDQFSDVNHEALQWVQDKSPEIKHKRESPFITPPKRRQAVHCGKHSRLVGVTKEETAALIEVF